MPRDGSGIFSAPFPNVVTATTIESTVHNGTVADFVTDANAPRPIVAGGTGATSAAVARTNLQAERAGQVVTNFDSHTWEIGSFTAAGSATNSPVGGHEFAGIVYGTAPEPLVVEARDLSDTIVPGRKYIREKDTSVAWTTWRVEAGATVVGDGVGFAQGDMWYGVRGSPAKFVVNSEDDLTGANLLQVNKADGFVSLNPINSAIFQLKKISASFTNMIAGWNAATPRWSLELGDASVAELFVISRYDDAGAPLGTPLIINRASGDVTLANILNVSGRLIASASQALTYDSGAVFGLTINSTNAATGGAPVLFLNSVGSTAGSISWAASQAGVNYNTTSDARLKEDEQPYARAREVIDALKVYDFKWKDSDARGIGLFAQDAREVFESAVTPPNAVTGDVWLIDYSKFVPALIADAQETHARLAAVEQQLAALLASKTDPP